MKFLGLEEQGEQLLPRIPNEVTLDLITPKLSYRDLHVLSSVSRRWQAAIRTREVYDARVRANPTETLMIHFHTDGLAFYSTTEERCYELPPIPWLCNLFREKCNFIALHGKLYVLQQRLFPCDMSNWKLYDFTPSPEMCSLDLATGQREWERCPSIQEARVHYACGAVGGKIYVLGGTTLGPSPRDQVLGAEMYDPQENNWRPIPHMTHEIYYCHKVAAVGKELLVWTRHRRNSTQQTDCWGYNPATNEWRSVERIAQLKISEKSKIFVAKEKFYMLSYSAIYVYDVDRKSWIHRHANFFPLGTPEDYSIHIRNIRILATDGELIVRLVWKGRPPQPGLQAHHQPRETFCVRKTFFHCRGLESEEETLVWQKMNCEAATRYEHLQL